MSLELTWSCSGSSGETVNVANPRSLSAGDVVNGPAWNLWWFKERLKEEGWSVVSSSNSATTSSSDLWGTGSFDATISATKNAKIVYALPAQAHSWMVLSAPTGSTAAGHYLIIDFCSTNSGIAHYNRAQFTIAKGAVGGGSTTARPTGSTEFGINTTNGCNAKDIIIYDDTTNNTAQHRVNAHFATNGAFYLSEAQEGKQKFSFFLAFLPLQNTHAADQNTWVLVGLDSYAGRSDSFSGNNPASLFTPSAYTGAALYYESSGAITGLSHNGTVLLSLAGIIPSVSKEGDAGGTTPLFFNTTMVSPNSSDSTYSDFPIIVINSGTGPIEFKGRLPDISWTSYNIPNGAVTPPKASPSSTYERTKFGMVWLPWVSTSAPII